MRVIRATSREEYCLTALAPAVDPMTLIQTIRNPNVWNIMDENCYQSRRKAAAIGYQSASAERG
jgi:hypothetical protein